MLDPVPIRILILSAALALAGCATQAGYKKVMDTWMGKPELDLVRKWGAPRQTYESGGSKFLTFATSRTISMPGTAANCVTNIIGNTAYTNCTGGSPDTPVALTCQTTFEIVGGLIAGWRASGNNCIAVE